MTFFPFFFGSYNIHGMTRHLQGKASPMQMTCPYERPQDLQVEVGFVQEAGCRPHQVGDDHSGGAVQTLHSVNEDSPVLTILKLGIS